MLALSISFSGVDAGRGCDLSIVSRHSENSRVSKLHWEDFVEGQVNEYGPRHVTRDEIVEFAREFDPQPFHLDEEAAKDTIFRGLAASGWHTAALTMRLLVESELRPAGGIVGAGFDEFRWPRRAGTPAACSCG